MVYAEQFSYLHNLILELGEEEVDDLVLLDGQRVEIAGNQSVSGSQSGWVVIAYISSMLLILPAFTRRPSLVTGCHSFSCANCQYPALMVFFSCARYTPRSFLHRDGHGHGHVRVHGHHRALLHENQILRVRNQPYCMSTGVGGRSRFVRMGLAVDDTRWGVVCS